MSDNLHIKLSRHKLLLAEWNGYLKLNKKWGLLFKISWHVLLFCSEYIKKVHEKEKMDTVVYYLEVPHEVSKKYIISENEFDPS